MLKSLKKKKSTDLELESPRFITGHWLELGSGIFSHWKRKQGHELNRPSFLRYLSLKHLISEWAKTPEGYSSKLHSTVMNG